MDDQTRQEYVKAAVSFLQNPKLVDSSLKDKLKFLRDKGLSDVEVDEALNLALVNRHQSQSGRWNFFLIMGLCIGGYKLYQAYLEGKAKQNERQQTSVESKPLTQKTNLLHNIHNEAQAMLNEDQPTLNEILKRMVELKKLVELQRSNFGTEIQSLKTLLLGHEKFAAPPKIPEWQLKDDTKQEEGDLIKGGKQKKEKKGNAVADVIPPSNGFNQSSVTGPNLG